MFKGLELRLRISGFRAACGFGIWESHCWVQANFENSRSQLELLRLHSKAYTYPCKKRRDVLHDGTSFPEGYTDPKPKP